MGRFTGATASRTLDLDLVPDHVDPAGPRAQRSPFAWLDGEREFGPRKSGLFETSALGASITLSSLQVDTDSASLTMRCGCASCVEAAAKAQAQAEKVAQGEAAWDAWYAANPGGETALLDDIKDGPTDVSPGSTYHVLDAQEGDSHSSQIDAPGDQDWYLVELSGGQSYKFTLTPADTSGTPGVSPDLLIEIYDSAGTLIQSYDSGSWGADEVATFTPGADGTFYINVKGWTPADFGGYTITAEINNDPGTTTGPLASINWGGDDNRVDTGNYTADGKMIIKVYFSQTGDLPYGSVDDPVVGLTWEEWAKEAAYQAFECYENIINVVFQEVSSEAEADFILAATASAPVILGRMRPPGEANAGLGEFNVLASTWNEEGLAQGAYMYVTLIHELGHGMGLAHPHDTGGGSEVMQGVTGDLATGYTYGAFDLNQGIYTTMSYNDGWDQAPHGGSNADGYGYQGTLMGLDVAMLQIKYGANTSFNSTDTVYALPTVNQAGTFYSCIWDTGGTDWIIAGAGIDVMIDLRPATLQYEAGGGGWVSYAAGIHGGFTIANGVVIENAVGGAGADTIIGNTAANWLFGGLDNDTIDGGDGDDRIEGGDGDDILTGGLGFDFVDYTEATAGVSVQLALTTAQDTGGAGVDTLLGFEAVRGSDFSDNLRGTNSANSLLGEDGDDTLDGEGGADSLAGGAGLDKLLGGTGDDSLGGDAGNDQLFGEAGIDSLLGGDGDDLLDGGDGADALNGGAGFDTAYYRTATAAVTVNLTTGVHAGFAAGDTFTSIERFILGKFNDAFTGSGDADKAYGQEGDDSLSGAGGADNLFGDAGADTLNGDGGDDVLEGGAGGDAHNGGDGFDRASYQYALAAVSLNLATGIHTGEAAGDTFSSIERITLSRFNDGFAGSGGDDRAEGQDGNDVLSGAGGADLLYGNNGTDTLNGEAGIDKLIGGAGNDTLDGGTEADTLYGEAGADTLLGGFGDDVLEGGAGADSYNGGDGVDAASFRLSSSAVSINLSSGVHTGDATGDTFVSVERFMLTAQADTFVGSSGADRAEGMGGNDTLSGGSGIDYLLGGDGIDTLNGDADGDKLFGDAGNDVLNGGFGKDQLYGGAGNDTLSGGGTLELDHFIVTSTGFGADIVVDFQNGVDKIRVLGVAGWDDFSDVSVSSNGSGWAVITFSDGSTITLEGVASGQVDASDFLWI